MATFSLTDALRTEYKTLFDSCTINPARSAEVEDAGQQADRQPGAV